MRWYWRWSTALRAVWKWEQDPGPLSLSACGAEQAFISSLTVRSVCSDTYLVPSHSRDWRWQIAALREAPVLHCPEWVYWFFWLVSPDCGTVVASQNVPLALGCCVQAGHPTSQQGPAASMFCSCDKRNNCPRRGEGGATAEVTSGQSGTADQHLPRHHKSTCWR